MVWTYKSRAPYRWEEKGKTKRSVPWVGFLGYQIRYDGLRRIRPASIAKQLVRQVLEADRILQLLRPRDGAPVAEAFPVRALTSFISRLTAIAGTPKQDGKPGRDWASGFRLLRDGEHVDTQLRKLDRGRGRQIRRLVRGLAAATLSSPPDGLLGSVRRYATSYAAALAAPNSADNTQVQSTASRPSDHPGAPAGVDEDEP